MDKQDYGGILSTKDGKLLFSDPGTIMPELMSKINYVAFDGKWAYRTIDTVLPAHTEHKLEFFAIATTSGLFHKPEQAPSLTISFPSFDERNKFVASVYSRFPLNQENSGVDLEKKMNSRLLISAGTISAGLLLFKGYRIWTKQKRQ